MSSSKLNNQPAAKASGANRQRDLELDERCKDHIRSLRLSAEEGISDARSFNGVDWLKEEAPWPPEVQRHVHRYMHEKNLYQVSNPDDPVFVEMVELVKSQAGVPNTRNWEQKVHDKCRDLINTSTRTWKRDGLLVARNNVTWKTGVFQYLWDCAIQAAHVSIVAAQSIERTLPRGEPSNSASSVNLDSMTGSGWRPDDNQSRKRSAGSMQQSWLPTSPKRARVAQSDAREDEGNSIEVDCEVFYVTSPERDLADDNTRHTSATSAVAPSDGRHHTDGNLPARFMTGLESTVMTAREALSALDPAEGGRRSTLEGIQLSQKNIGPDFATESRGDPVPTGCSIHENCQTNATNWSASHSNPVSSVRLATALEGLGFDQAASLEPMAGPKTNQSDTSSRESLPLIRPTTNTDAMNPSLNPDGNNGHFISTSKQHEAENNLHNSSTLSRSMSSSPEIAPETGQVDRRYGSLTAQTTTQVLQPVSRPNNQVSFTNGAQSSPSNQPGDEITSPSNPDIISEEMHSPAPCRDCGSSNCQYRVANASYTGPYPQNLSQAGRDGQSPFEQRFSQATAEQPAPPPPMRTDQSTILGPSGPPPPPAPSISRQNAWPNGPPLPPPRHASSQNQGLPQPGPPPPSAPPPNPRTSSQNHGPLPPPMSPQKPWPTGPPPPPQRAPNPSQGPSNPPVSQILWPNRPPPQRAPNPNQGSPTPPVPQNLWPNGPPPPQSAPNLWSDGRPPPPPPQRAPGPWLNGPPPPPQRAANLWPNGPPPPQRASNPNQGVPTPPVPQNLWPNGPPPPPRRAFNSSSSPPPPPPPPPLQPPPPNNSNQNQGRPPPGFAPVSPRSNYPPSPAQGSPSSSASSTQDESTFPAHASNSVAGHPPPQFPSLDQQQPSSSPWHLSQHTGRPPPAPTQSQPVGPPLAPSGFAYGPPVSTPTSIPGPPSQEALLKKYNEMLIIHVAVNAQTPNANLINIGQRMWATLRFLAGDVFSLTVAELFQSISGLLNTAPPSQLVFEFRGGHSKLGTGMNLDQGNSKSLDAVKAKAWEYFREIETLDSALATVTILIIPIFSAAIGSVGENMQQQPQQLHSAYTASNIPSDQPSYQLVSNQNGSSIASDAAYHRSTTQPGGPPPQQSPSSFPISPAPHPTNSPVRPSVSASSSMPTPRQKTTPEGNIPNSNNNIVHASSSPDPQQPTQTLPPHRSKTDTSKNNGISPPPKIVLRIQIDSHGRLSHSYDKPPLHARTTSTQFFAWFARETGRTSPSTSPQKLRFDFKDAVPAKTSVVAAGNDDHFDLMVGDIKRKVERAAEFMPGLKEFCIVVTDPAWVYGGDGDSDGVEDE